MTPSTPPAIIQPAPGPVLKGIEFFDASGSAHYISLGIPCPALWHGTVDQTPSHRITAIVSCAGAGITPEIIDEPTPAPTATPVHGKR